MVIFLGSNDASMATTNPEQAVPLEEFGDNLLRIISLLLSKVGGLGIVSWSVTETEPQGLKRESLIVVSPPPVMPEKWSQHRNLGPGPSSYQNCKDNELTRKYAEECGLVSRR